MIVNENHDRYYRLRVLVTCRRILQLIAQTIANTIPMIVIKLARKIAYTNTLLNHLRRKAASTINVTLIVSLIK